MVTVKFIGKGTTLQALRESDQEDLRFITTDHDEVRAVIYEVDSLETLYKVPKNMTLPTFFLMSTQDKAVAQHIKEYQIAGLFFQPPDINLVIAKLTAAVNNITQTKRSDNQDIMKIKLLAKSENIPPLPSLAIDLISLTKSNNTAIQAIVDKIKQDQGITTKLIKLVNSPFYGIKNEITSIERSTVLLGFGTIKNIALALSLDSFFHKQFGLYQTTGKAMWEHSYKVAVIGQLLASLSDPKQDLDIVYLAGLMHDIGKVVMVDVLVKEVHSLVDEREQLGFDHQEIGIEILSRWLVDSRVAKAVGTHHNTDATEEGRYIYYANMIDNAHPEELVTVIEEACFSLDILNPATAKEKILALIESF